MKMGKKSKIDPNLQSKLGMMKARKSVSVIVKYKKRTLMKVRDYLKSDGIKLCDETDLLKRFEMFCVSMTAGQVRKLAKQEFITRIGENQVAHANTLKNA
jgi:hypothetical protein